jgi:NAD+ synthase (glutamine-hydrolysing)
VRIEKIKLPSIPGEPGKGRPAASPMPAEMTEIEEIFHALVLGIRDYFHKNGFQKALVGLSGGIDSSLTAALATEALGSSNVHGIFMPSPFSSEQSHKDAAALAKNLKVSFQVLPIDPIYESYLKTLKPAFGNRRPDVTEENIQARIRGNLLMALSNKFGWLVLTTGNKSETSVGYCTLYGDTAGGLAVLKDVPKMTVYALSRFVNRARGKEVIPRSVIEKAPSAELRPNQRDADSLPPYEQLDPVLQAYVEEDLSLEEIVHLGHPRKQVQEVLRMVDRNEYKRRQGPPGLKITPKAFGRDRRLPITNRYNS